MPDERRQDEDFGFKKIFALIAATHLAVLGLILFLSFQPLKPRTDTLVWMAPGSFADAASESGQSAVSQAAPTPSEPREPTADAADEPAESQTPTPPPPTLPTPAPPAKVTTPPPTPAPVVEPPKLNPQRSRSRTHQRSGPVFAGRTGTEALRACGSIQTGMHRRR